MYRTTILAAGTAALLLQPVVAFAASQTFNLRLTVPELCNLGHIPAGSISRVGDAYSLGTFREYCNSPRGYTVQVNYTPGALRGAILVAGSDSIILDGSGRAVLSRSAGPRIRSRDVSIAPGANGFDTNHLQFDIIPG